MNSRLLFDHAIKCYDILDSTNSYATELLKSENIREGTIIWAIEQTNGRGQQATKWQSAANMSLTFSQILHPHFLKVSKIAYLGMIIALAVQESLAEITNEKINIKWPNDIYFKNKKVCGILIENGIKGMNLSHAVIGIGVNVNQTSFPDDAAKATSLLQITNKNFIIEDVLIKIQHAIAEKYTLLEEEKYQTIKWQYLQNLVGFHQEVNIESETYSGKAQVIDVLDNGKIVLQTSNAQQLEFGIKEVKWIL